MTEAGSIGPLVAICSLTSPCSGTWKGGKVESKSFTKGRLLVICTIIVGAAASTALFVKTTKNTDPLKYASPKETFKTYIKAIRINDLRAANECWVFDGENSSNALDVIVGFWIATRQANQIVKEKFGDDARHRTLHGWCRDDVSDQALELTEKRLDQSEVRIMGDTAKLRIRWADDDGSVNPAFDFRELTFFRKVDGKWKMDANRFTGQKQSNEFFEAGSWGPLIREQVDIMNEIVAKLKHNSLKTEDELDQFVSANMATLKKKLEERKLDRNGKQDP